MGNDSRMEGNNNELAPEAPRTEMRVRSRVNEPRVRMCLATGSRVPETPNVNGSTDDKTHGKETTVPDSLDNLQFGHFVKTDTKGYLSVDIGFLAPIASEVLKRTVGILGRVAKVGPWGPVVVLQIGQSDTEWGGGVTEWGGGVAAGYGLLAVTLTRKEPSGQGAFNVQYFGVTKSWPLSDSTIEVRRIAPVRSGRNGDRYLP